MVENLLRMASTVFNVGLVLPVKILLNDADEMPMKSAKVCWVMCWLSINCLILSFIIVL